MGSDRAELARLCSARNWSKAIRLLDSILARSPSSIHDLWYVAFSPAPIREIPPIHSVCLPDPYSAEFGRSNRAFCYSQLELHKHVVKDCDRALLLDPALLQAYILKGSLRL